MQSAKPASQAIMRVFVTGAAGFIGQATVQELVKNGHQVLGLARSDASIEKIKKAGGEPHKGELTDIESLKSGAKASDGVIHLAFVHDFSNFPAACATDRAAIEAMAEVLAGTGKPLVIAGGTLSLPKGTLGYEHADAEREGPMTDRALSADLVYKLSKEKNIRGSVVRIPPTVHGKGEEGFIPMLAKAYREKGSVIYVGDGSVRWPAIQRYDLATIFRLALEKGTAGATYHGVAEQGVSFKDITAVMGKKLNLPVKGESAEEALADLGFSGHVICLDNPTSSDHTQKELGWHPTQIGLLADIEENYF